MYINTKSKNLKLKRLFINYSRGWVLINRPQLLVLALLPMQSLFLHQKRNSKLKRMQHLSIIKTYLSWRLFCHECSSNSLNINGSHALDVNIAVYQVKLSRVHSNEWVQSRCKAVKVGGARNYGWEFHTITITSQFRSTSLEHTTYLSLWQKQTFGFVTYLPTRFSFLNKSD